MKAVRSCLFLPVILFLIQAGCSLSKGGVPQSKGSGFIRDEFLQYRSVAILPFEGDPKGEAAEAFTMSFHEKFPDMTIVGRKEVLKSFREEDLFPNRINEAARAQIGKALGVQALVAGSVYYPSIVRWLMQVQIIDVRTGNIMGRSLAEVDFIGSWGIKEGARLAVEELKPR